MRRTKKWDDDVAAIVAATTAEGGEGWILSNDNFRDHWGKTLKGVRYGELRSWLRRRQLRYRFSRDGRMHLLTPLPQDAPAALRYDGHT